jgi:hypothetical protein
VTNISQAHARRRLPSDDEPAEDTLLFRERTADFLAHADFIVRRKAVKAIRDHETGER